MSMFIGEVFVDVVNVSFTDCCSSVALVVLSLHVFAFTVDSALDVSGCGCVFSVCIIPFVFSTLLLETFSIWFICC